MVEVGQKVLVRYRGFFDDDTEFDGWSHHADPFVLTVGAGRMLPSFEKAVSEMSYGEKKTIHVPMSEAYGSYDETLVETAPLDQIPFADQLPLGRFIVLSGPAGATRVKVAKIFDGKVYFDHNHELAGKDLNFDIELVSAVHESAVEHEIHPAGCACGCDKLKTALEK